MNTPMQLLCQEEVSSERDEYSRSRAEAEQKIGQDDRDTVNCEQQGYPGGGAAQIHVLCFIEGSVRHVMFEMLSGKRCSRKVQEVAMIGVLEVVSPQESGDKAEEQV